MQFNIMPRIYARQFTLVHIAKSHSTKLRIISGYFPMSGFRAKISASTAPINTTVPWGQRLVTLPAEINVIN